MIMIRKTGSLMAVLVLAWAFAPLSVRAATTWNTAANPTSTSCPVASCSNQHEGLVVTDPNMIPYGNQFTFTSTSGNLPLNATSYFVSSNATSSALQAANIEEYTGNGIGVTSQTVNPSFLENVGNTPGHTIDNQGVYDMVVFQLPSSNFDVTQIALKTFSTTQYASGAADFTILVGGNASANALTLAGFAGKTLAQLTGTGVGNYGFTPLDYTNATGGTFNVNPGGLTGRYLIVIASLTNTSRNDDFKISSITGTTLIRKVDEPSSITLLLAATLSILYFRRRTAAIRR